ncbi:hypothetical protein GDO81_009342 [Engystomops pustulosus]|uniref:Uncharacterized protein n=1 Tax=Engystomops pustulosus TaxID=76066 RepID=A0AAV7BQ68_ENGPU|nr:hypothetical protein GDO81_009342 [Engystomops pustulosus]
MSVAYPSNYCYGSGFDGGHVQTETLCSGWRAMPRTSTMGVVMLWCYRHCTRVKKIYMGNPIRRLYFPC